MLVDTHCHIHEPSYPIDSDEVLQRAHTAGVEQLICVGTSEKSSREAVEFAANHAGVFASVGVHPHDTKDGWGKVSEILAVANPPSTPPLATKQANLRHVSSAADSLQPAELALLRQSSPGQEPAPDETGEQRGDQKNSNSRGSKNSIVAVGEIGLDYFYTHSPRETQIKALEEQISLALKHNLPIIFHVREAFDDFWPIFDNFHGLRGVLHSFTDTQQHMEEALKRDLYIGVNGISTFTKDPLQKTRFTRIPLEKLLLETDAPFLTPAPFRGKVNEPAFVRNIAKYHAEARGLSLEEIAAATTTNARALFALT